MNTDEFFPWLVRQDVKHELVNGQPEKFLGVTLRHRRIAIKAATLFDTALKGTKWNVLNSQIGVKIPSGNVRYPDLSIDAGAGSESDMWATEPVFALLVFSDSPAHHAFESIDRVEDFRMIPSLRYLLRVDAETPRAALDLRGANGVWKFEKFGINGTIDLPEIGLSFPVFDLYDGLSITTAEAAEYLDCSRPYVIMLSEEGKLEGVTQGEDGQRLIPIQSLIKWKNEHQYDVPPTYKESATEAGMYAIPDEEWLKNFKREDEK